MVDVDKAVFARLQKKGKEFEILVDPELAVKAKEDLKKGKDVEMNDILAAEGIFFDTKKGTRAGKKDLILAFDTDDAEVIAKMIVRDGKIYTSQDQRHKQTQEKWDRIVALIAMNAIDAKTKIPIPKKTVEDALRKAVFRIDDNKTVENQMQDAIKKIKELIPLSFNQKTLQINNIAPNLVTPCLNLSKNLGSITKENWNQDKSLTLTVSVPVGLKEEFIDRLNAITHGNADIKIMD
ncbi:ribosome assembly factor SBDS [Candidatus Woesearchaeota archaeon]|nr:ribosome assembly factor SBDS [Candidatus Woesearchaeota archaeon]